METTNNLEKSGFEDASLLSEHKRTEERLRASEARYRALYEAHPLAVVTVQPDGIVVSINPLGVEQLGYSSAELQGQPIQSLFVDEDRQTVTGQIEASAGDSSRILRAEVRQLSRDGSVVWLKQTTRSFEDGDGRTLIMLAFEDITEIRQADAALRNSEEWFSRTFNTSPVSMVVRRIRDSVYVDVNEAFIRSSGYSRNDIIGKSDNEVNVWVNESERLQAKKILLEQGRVINLEASVRRKDGMIRVGLFSAEVIVFDGDECVLIAMNDITERKQVEEALRRSEERFSKAFRAGASPASITTFEEGRYVDVNESFLQSTGYAREEVLGRTSVELGVWEDPDQRNRILAVLKAGGTVRDVELHYRTKAGKLGVWLLSAELVEMEGQRFIIATRNDITERKRAEDELRASEERFSMAFNASPVPMSISKNEVFLDVNTSFLTATGYSRDEVIGKTAGELNLWIDQPDRDRLKRDIETRRVRNMEVRFRMKSGRIRTFLMSTDIIETSGVRSVLAVTNDITDRKIAEEALRASEERFSMAFNASPTPMSINRLSDGRYLAINDVGLRMNGYAREDMIGRTPAELGVYADPADRDRIRNALAEHGAIRDLEVRSRAKGGRERTVLLSADLIELDGEMCVLSSSIDITDRKEAEQALRASEAKFAAAFNASPGPMAITRYHGGNYLAVNDMTLSASGYTREEMVGRSPLDLNLWVDPDHFYAVGRILQEQGSVRNIEARMKTKGGEVGVYLLSSSLIEIDGELCVLSTAIDITERKRAEEALQSLVAGTASVTGEAFFPEVVRHVANALGVRYAMVTEILRRDPLRMRTLAFWLGDRWRDNFEYDAAKTPCEQVLVTGQMCYYENRLQELFIEDKGLRDLGAVSYLGTPLRGSSGKVIGHLCVMDVKPLLDDPRTRSVVTIFAARAAAELERKRAEDALRESEARVRRLVESNIIGIVIGDITGRIHVANDAFLRMLGYTREDVESGSLSWASLTPPDFAYLNDRAIAELRHSGVCTPFEKEYWRKDGSRVPVLVGVAMLEGSKDTSIAFVLDLSEQKAAQAALRESELHFRALIENSSDAIALFAPDGTVLYASTSTTRVLGYSADEFTGRNVYEFIHPDDIAQAAEKHQRLLEHPEQPLALTVRVKHKNGEWRWIEFDLANMLGDRAVQAVVGNYRDVTERFRAEHAVRESERRFRALIENSSDAIALVNAQVRIFYASPATNRVLGYQPEELLGRDPLDIVHPDDRSATKRGLQQLVRQAGRVMQYVHRALHKNGDWRWIETTSTNLLNEASVRAIVINYRDVTERKRAEEEQAQLQSIAQNVAKEWRLTFDAVEFPILLIDFEGQVARLNHAAMTLAGREYREIKGLPVQKIGSGEPWELIADMVGKVRSDRTSISQQTRDRVTGKSWEIAASPFSRFEEGEKKVIVLARDISGMTELQESLRRSETMSAMGRLVAGVAHEVRNPLFGISATIDAFRARFGDPEEHRQYLTILKGQVDRLSSLMSELLEYGKPLNKELVRGSIETVIGQAVLECKTLAERGSVHIVTDIRNNLALVLMDRGRLLQVFRNLVENAIQHSPPETTVSICAENITGDGHVWVQCVVEDYGPGFQNEDLPRVFDPFFTRRRGGTGLGLSIVQRIVEEHNGALSLSNRTGKGARVVLNLPAADD